MKRHGFGAAGAAAILLGLSSCGDVVQTEETSSDLLRVQKNISALAGTPDVHVYLDGAMHLSVRVANSSLNQRSDPEKRRKADEVAREAYASYKSRSNLEAVTVALLVRRTHLRFFNSTMVEGAWRFAAGDLATGSVARSEGWIPAEAPMSDLYFVAIGEVPSPLMSELVSHVQKRFNVPVTLLDRLSFDWVTFDPERSQFVAEDLISVIRRRYPALARDPRARVIGITPFDMYMRAMANQWRFTFSLRNENDHFAVVSYARMDPVNVREPPDPALLAGRLRKMVIKNIGIMCYGLSLSEDPGSVLYGQIGGVTELDRMSEYFEPRDVQ